MEILAEQDGLIYNSQTKEVISDFKKGNKIYPASDVEIFYGTIEEFKEKNILKIE